MCKSHEWKFSDFNEKKDVIEFLNRLSENKACFSDASSSSKSDTVLKDHPCIVEYWIKLSQLMPWKEAANLIQLKVINDDFHNGDIVGKVWIGLLKNGQEICDGKREIRHFFDGIKFNKTGLRHEKIHARVRREEIKKMIKGDNNDLLDNG